MENINERVQKFNTAVQGVKTQLRRDLVGQDEVVDNVVIAIIAGGNVLLEGVPGVGKTRLVRSLGKTLNLPFSRIQRQRHRRQRSLRSLRSLRRQLCSRWLLRQPDS
jgi:MoxR-like ATPase